MKKTDYLYYSPAPSVYDGECSATRTLVKYVLRILLVFVLGIIVLL